MAAPVLQELAARHDMLLETRKRDGSWVATPVNPVVEDDHIFFRTWDRAGKVKRLRNFPEVRITPSTASGKPRGRALEGRAHLLEGDEAGHAAGLIDHKYPLLQRVFVRLYHRARHFETMHYVVEDVHPQT